MPVTITIDQEGCTECGACEGTCAEIFEVPSGEKARVVEKYRKGSTDKGEVGDDLAGCAQEAADSCPVEVISVK